MKRQQPDLGFYQISSDVLDMGRVGLWDRELGIILHDLLHPGKGGLALSYLLLGARGCGKTYLLKRLQTEIEVREDLSRYYCVIYLPEEQANIYRLFDLMEDILRELEQQGLDIEWPVFGVDVAVYCRALFERMQAVLDQRGRRLVLLLDNIDRIIENLDGDAVLLREYLSQFTGLTIIGASIRMREELWRADKAFYDFFRVLELHAMGAKEVRSLLLGWSEQWGVSGLREVVEQRPGLLETVRLLTDSQPRTWLYFANLLGAEGAYDHLRLLVDRMTPLYRERLNGLPPGQRKIVLQLAFCWEAVGAGELGAVCRMENKLVSAQLNQLIEKGVAQKIETGKKNFLYRVADRFFNFWLIVTQGGVREKRRARYLAGYLEHYYDEMAMVESFEQQCVSRLGASVVEKAAAMTRSFAQARSLVALLDNLSKDEAGIAGELALARSYEQAGEYGLAGEYYRKGVEDQLPKAVACLVSFYYRHNQHRKIAYEMLSEIDYDHLLPIVPVIKAWNGHFEDLEEDIRAALLAGLRVEYMLKHLLIHRQVNLVCRFFRSVEFGVVLQEKYAALYYAAQIQSTDNRWIYLKIPPELLEVVNMIGLEIERLRNFYYDLDH